MELQLMALVLGLIIGSFLNVMIHRLPLEQSFFKPMVSTCPSCEHRIRWHENIPIFSYLYLRGKCANCKEQISPIYPIVELLTAIITVLLVSTYWLDWELALVLVLFYTLIVLSFIDFKYKAVPDYLLIIAVALTLILGDIYDALMFAGGFALIELVITFYIQNIKAKITKNKELETQRAMGEGDIPIAGVIGGILGLYLGISAIFLGAMLALLPSIYNLFSKKEIETPFIPYLSLGLFITYMTGFNIFDWFLYY